MAYITIVKGDDTDFLDNQYLVVKFNTEIELAGFQAIFKLGSIELVYPDLSAKYIEIVLSKEVTSALQKGKMYGTLKLVDTENRTRTVTTVLPFNVVTKVMNTSQISQQSIQLEVKVEQNEISVDMNILGLSKTVAENYLTQMKQNNAQMTEKLQALKLMELEVEQMHDEVVQSHLMAEKWATAEGLVNGVDYSAKYYANQAVNSEQAVKSTLSNTLNKSQIANCLLEVPQRIKYDLTDGTLTIKAGSVVIVPYGIEDLTADYPVGATFLHENFKVYDTQYEDGKFFVWAELVEDIVRPAISTTSTSERWAFFEIDLNNYDAFGTGVSGTEAVTNSICYRTDLNKCVCYNTSGAVKSEACCLPFMKVLANGIYVEGSVTQLFNGMGYIGGVVWLDKGVKGLKTNGRNADGSLSNIEFTTHKLSTWTSVTNGEYYGLILEDDNHLQMSFVDGTSYDSVSNYIYRADGNFPVACMAMKVNFSNGSVTSFIPYQAFQAVNYNQYKQDLSQVTTNYRDSISWFASPSNNSTALTLGASNSTYTAPDNGWFYLWLQFTTTNPSMILRNTSAGMGYQIHGYEKGGYELAVPCSTGQSIVVQYNGTISSSNFRFVYMRGAV